MLAIPGTIASLFSPPPHRPSPFPYRAPPPIPRSKHHQRNAASLLGPIPSTPSNYLSLSRITLALRPIFLKRFFLLPSMYFALRDFPWARQGVSKYPFTFFFHQNVGGYGLGSDTPHFPPLLTDVRPPPSTLPPFLVAAPLLHWRFPLRFVLLVYSPRSSPR